MSATATAARKLPMMDATRKATIHIHPRDAVRGDPAAIAAARDLGARSVTVEGGYTTVELPAKVAAQYGTPPRSRGPVLVRFKSPTTLEDETTPHRRRRRGKIGTPTHPYKGAHARRLQYRFETMERTHYITGKRHLSIAALAAQLAATQPDLRDADAIKLSEYLAALSEAAKTVESLLEQKHGTVTLMPVSDE